MMFDGSKLTRLPFLPFRYGTILASEVNGPNAGIAYHPIEAKAFDLDYLKMMPKIRTFRIPMWDGLLFDLAPISEASNGKNNELHILPDRPHLIGIFNIFAILPDRALGPIKIQIGEDTPRFQDRVAEQTKSAPPRDRLPPEYQKDQRTWVEKREDLHAIQPGIHLDMVRAKGGTKLVLKFRLPWLRQDSVHLDLDPYVLQGMDVPQGIKEIGLVNPQGAIRRETDGWHLLGMTWKTTAKGRSADANAVASANPQSPIPNPQSAFDLRVDQLLVTGVDFALVDNTVEPPMYVPLKGLDVEVRGFATAGADVKTPMRFNVIATAGEVPLPQTRRSSASASEEPADLPLADIEDSSEPSTMENRLLFQELSATGRLTLYPRPDGWVKAGLSGLELVNFRGVASESGVTLRKGVFDASVDMRFHKDQPLSTRARLVFTDLSLTEPPDGFLAQLLTLPASLDTVLFILRDAGGSIRLPLSFKIGEDGLSRGQITQAAVGAAATLIAGAVAGSPYRVAGTIGNILGGDKEEASGAETYVVEYAAGITMLSDRQAAELAQIAERLRNERDLAVTVRHHLGAADIEKAAGLVNLSEPQTKALLAKLRQERTELRRRRDELAGQTRAAYAAGSRGNVTTRTRQLQQAETQLGLIEQALDNLLETMRPGSEYAVRRRTQDACIAIGKARIETVAALLAIEPAADGPEASGRVTFVPPRFTEAGDPAGRITLTLSKSKAR